ncbi:MAG: alpha/beta fold hydrolase [Bdellovibrionota bacterium]
MPKNFYQKPGFRVLAGVLGALALVFFVVTRTIPLELAEIGSRVDLWRHQVMEVDAEGLHGYVKDTCAQSRGAQVARSECTCVALIHGMGDNAMTWRKILDWPANGWVLPVKIYAFDLPGTGKSTPPATPDGYRVRNQAAALKAVLAPICPHWTIVGNSLGGWIGAWLTLDWPEGVSKLVLADAAGLKSQLKDMKSILGDPTVESMKEFQKAAYAHPRPLPDYVWKEVVAKMKSSNVGAVRAAQVEADFLDSKLQSLHRPTLVFWGDSDHLTSVESGHEFQTKIPGAIWELARECGHMPQKECPVELIKAINQMLQLGGV